MRPIAISLLHVVLISVALAQRPNQFTSVAYVQQIKPTTVQLDGVLAAQCDMASNGIGHHLVLPSASGNILYYQFDNTGVLQRQTSFASNASQPSITSLDGVLYVTLQYSTTSQIQLWRSTDGGQSWTLRDNKAINGTLVAMDSYSDFRGIHIAYTSTAGVWYYLRKLPEDIWAAYDESVGGPSSSTVAVTCSPFSESDSVHILTSEGLFSFHFPSAGPGQWNPSTAPVVQPTLPAIAIVKNFDSQLTIQRYCFALCKPASPNSYYRCYRRYETTDPWSAGTITNAATRHKPSVVVATGYPDDVSWPTFIFADGADANQDIHLYRTIAALASGHNHNIYLNTDEAGNKRAGRFPSVGYAQGGVVALWRDNATGYAYTRRKPYPLVGVLNEDFALTDTNWIIGPSTLAAGKNLRLKNGSVTYIWGQYTGGGPGRLTVASGGTLTLEGTAKLILESPTESGTQGGQIELPSNYSLIIPSTAQLIAKAGSKITFGPGASLVSYGKVTMTGSVSRKVELVGTPNWSGMSLSGSGSNGSKLEYVKISGVTSTGGSALLINNSTNDTVRYCNISNNSGIFTNGVNLVSAGSPDVSFDTLKANGGYGIVFQGTNGNFYGNVVKYNNTAGGRYQGGGVRCISASPQFGRLGFPAYQGNNTIKGISPTDNSNGVAAYTASYPYVGSASSSYYGYNDIDSALQRVYANGSDVMAEQCWWGSSSPNPAWFVTSNGTIDWQPYLSTDPTTMGPGVVTSQSVDSIRIAMDYRASGDYPEAQRILQSLISTAPDAMEARLAASVALHLYRDTHDAALFELVRDVWIRHWQGDGLFSLIIGKMLIEQSRFQEAAEVLNAVAQSNPGSELERNALLDVFYMFMAQIDHIDEAGAVLRRLEYGFADDPDILGARSLYSQLRPPLRPAERPGTTLEVVSSPGLFSSYPNPFNASARLRFDLSSPASVSIVIYDILGRKVAELVNGNYETGSHAVTWNASDVASGVYLARLSVLDKQSTTLRAQINKLILMK